MNELWILACFFVFVMGLVSLAGYWFMTSGKALPEGAPDATSVLLDAMVTVGGGVEVKDTKGIKKKLAYAGYRREFAVPIFNAMRYGAMVLAALTLGIASSLQRADLQGILIPAMCGAGLGFIGANRLLDARVKSRSEKLRFGIPPALDMIVLSLEAGQSLDSAIMETSREMRDAYPELSYELNLTQLELLASKSRLETFRNLAERNAEPEIKRLAQVLIDSDRFGTALAPALRSHTKYLRLRMRQAAREAARKVGVKLVFPVFFLIFPSVLLVTLGPAVLMIYYQLGPMLNGNP